MLLEAALALRVGGAREVELLELRPRVVRAVLVGGLVLDGRLRRAAGNFYINDKPTGAVVGQQPFGGSRASGTNDKAGSSLNLYRWVSARTVKETFAPVDDYRYPFMEEC